MKPYYQKSLWLRDENGSKVGLLLAYTDYKSDYEEVYIGFSFCDTRYDKFDKNQALDLAEMRAEYLSKAINYEKILEKIPYKHRDEFLWFLKGCTRYFKDRYLPTWVDRLMEIYE